MITWSQYIALCDYFIYYIEIIISIFTLNYYKMPNNPDYIERYNGAKNNQNSKMYILK